MEGGIELKELRWQELEVYGMSKAQHLQVFAGRHSKVVGSMASTVLYTPMSYSSSSSSSSSCEPPRQLSCGLEKLCCSTVLD